MTTAINSRPLSAITHDAVILLYRELGVVETVRFLQQFGRGYGNYTEERGLWLEDVTVDDLVAQIKKRRKAASTRKHDVQF